MYLLDNVDTYEKQKTKKIFLLLGNFLQEHVVIRYDSTCYCLASGWYMDVLMSQLHLLLFFFFLSLMMVRAIGTILARVGYSE